MKQKTQEIINIARAYLGIFAWWAFYLTGKIDGAPSPIK